MSIYGPIVEVDHLDQAVTEFIKKWFPGYLGEVGSRKIKDSKTSKLFGRKDLQMFRSYANLNDLDKWPEEQLPACITIIPDTTEVERDGEGKYTAMWPVGVAVILK